MLDCKNIGLEPDSSRCLATMPGQNAGDRRAPHVCMRCLLAIRHSKAFRYFMTLTILFNCATFVLDGRNVPATTQDFMDTSNLACLIVFTIEILVCFAADGFKKYWGDSWNKFDVIVVGLSWILDYSVTEASLSVFRILRVLKPLRLLKRIGPLQDLLEMYGLSSKAFASIYLILALGLLLFAVVGLQSFSNLPASPYVCTRNVAGDNSPATNIVPLIAPNSFNRFDHVACRPSEDGSWWAQRCLDSQCRSSSLLPPAFQGPPSISRSSFDSFGPSIFTVYCMVQLEGWSDLMYDSMHSISAAMSVYWVIFVIVLVFGMNRSVQNVPFFSSSYPVTIRQLVLGCHVRLNYSCTFSANNERSS